jgi:hypothetical protein
MFVDILTIQHPDFPSDDQAQPLQKASLADALANTNTDL